MSVHVLAWTCPAEPDAPACLACNEGETHLAEVQAVDGVLARCIQHVLQAGVWHHRRDFTRQHEAPQGACTCCVCDAQPTVLWDSTCSETVLLTPALLVITILGPQPPRSAELAPLRLKPEVCRWHRWSGRARRRGGN